MLIFEKKESIQSYLKDFHSENLSIGFVPTMGALHKGHLSLISRSKLENDITVASIFVNPTQFDNPEDLKKYPSTLEKDVSLLKEVECDLVFIPSAIEMYGDNLRSEGFDFGGIENQMEGAFRKGHFDGVGTIVKRFFLIINPTKAYFGEKDFQQLQIVKKLVEIENMSTQIIGCPIHRENNGLAMSSRNQRLSKEEQEQASFLYKLLQWVKEFYANKTIDEINKYVSQEFEKHPSLTLEYFTIADENSLQTMSKKSHHQVPRAFIAAFINSVRLIDNLSLSNESLKN